MFFSTILTTLTLRLLCGSMVCVLLIAIYYYARVRTVARYRHRADSERPDKADADYVPASVVVYSQGDSENLTELLGRLLNQDYPAAFEVIVVNEGESADVRDTVSMLRSANPNLYLTFTPEGVVNLSRKKLALTLGIKAARYGVVALTTTAAVIRSERWLRGLLAPFSPGNGVEVVLGYAYADPDEDCARGKRRRAFDHIARSTRWLGAAIAGKPFRGTEYNIAYTKEIFMRNKGFARSLNLVYGDDDIFISRIATRDNTRVELSDDSMVEVRYGNSPRMARERHLRQAFTEGFIKRRPRVLFGLAGWLHIVAVGLAVAAAVAGWPNMLPLVAAVAVVIALAAIDILTWRPIAKALKSRPLIFSIPWLAFTYPLRRVVCKMRSRFGSQKRYTWD